MLSARQCILRLTFRQKIAIYVGGIIAEGDNNEASEPHP